MSLNLIFKLVERDWRSGELRLLMIALIVAVGTVATISLTVGRLQSAMLIEAGAYIGADASINGTYEIPQDYRDKAAALNLQTSDRLSFTSMIRRSETSTEPQLVSVRAVDAEYPLRGAMKVAEEPFVAGDPTDQVPRRGSVWLDSRLFPALDVNIGETVRIGYADLAVEKVVTLDPAQGGSIWDMGPRLVMRIEDVAKTEIIQPGSRIEYGLLMAGDRDDVRAMYSAVEPTLRPNHRWDSIAEAQASIGRALDRAERFFLLGGSLSVLLAGVAIALSARRYATRHIQHVGIMKTLGASPNDVFFGYLSVVGVIGFIGICIGMIIGLSVHSLMIWYFADLLPPFIPGIEMRPFVLSAITGLVCLATFTTPQILRLKDISPLQVLRRDSDGDAHSMLSAYIFAGIGSFCLLLWYAENPLIVIALLVGIAFTCAAFGLIAYGLLAIGHTIGASAGKSWKLAVGSLRRRRASNTGQILIFGLGIMILLIIYLLRTTLIGTWQEQLPEDVPNHFVMNVSNAQAPSVTEFLQERADFDGYLVPILQGRIIKVNGEDAEAYQKRITTDRWPRINSPRQLSYLADLPDNNEIVDGSWWGPENDEPQVSISDDIAGRFRLTVGDQLTFNVGGEEVLATVTSLREVEWENYQLNFYYILNEAAIGHLPATFMSAFRLPEDDTRAVYDLISEHPTISVIDVGSIINQIRRIVDQATTAIEWVVYLVLASGALVLIAAIQASRDERIREYALIRSLGGRRKLIGSALVAEFVILGAFAGLVASFGAELTAYTIETLIFEFETYELNLQMWPIGVIGGTLLVLLIGYLSTFKLITTPPMRVLRDV